MGFDPDNHTAKGPHQSPPDSPPSGANPQGDDGPRLEPPEPPQLVLPSLSKRLSSIVKHEVRFNIMLWRIVASLKCVTPWHLCCFACPSQA